MSDVRSSVLGGSYAHPADASARIQFRRALTLAAMTLVMPGSAQLVMGNKRVGRICVRVWLAFLAVGAVVLFLALFSRQTLLSLTLDSSAPLTIGRWILVAGAVAWVALMVDAWRLGRPLEMRRNHRLWMTGLNSVLCFVTAGVMFFAAHLVSTANASIGTVFASGTVSKPEAGRYNVLLLGGDSGPDRSGVRPDSLTVASIDKDTGRTVLIGLPRNLEDVPFPAGSVMDKQFPDGFSGEGNYLNAVNTWANDHADLFGTKDPGLDATMGAVEEITGLKLNYYAMVNMHGFSKLIDAVGGVRMNVRERTAIGGIGSPIRGYIEPGEQKLTGDQALWYSRSRVLNSDFSRMGRQKCVMNAMLQQLSPKKVLFNVEKIAKSSKSMLTTSIPRQDLDVFADLALKAKTQKVSTVSLVPPVIYTGNPDYPKVRRLIDKAIAKAEGRATAEAGISTAKLTLPKAGAKKKDPTKANQSSDLGAAC
ncbi:LCP family protein [Aeromicrobium chenweiae]|uniref:LytR family transcriptional regulator n=1 Tax=Aeromicrobium chenweiae TaxID=2079793 RepID=A0A2S0WP01_9ACTN|nr:LCP family protein [Aeromicrobium chenweiae]AWB93032.1 LytR family transcriptional regulator [Aeromicrobium chenweiae]TGN34022.1 LytR family transcriptional regulator [Aeromicrobium chenweiae]